MTEQSVAEPQSRFQVSCSIVLYQNQPSEILGAIRSFLAVPLRISLTLIDNSPNDQLRSIVELTGAQYIHTGKNVGFGKGHNLAIRNYLDHSEYHLVLNPDVHFAAETVGTLHRFMQVNRDVGLVMPRVLYPDGNEQPLCKLVPSPLDLFVRRFGGRLGRTFLRRRADRYILKGMDLSVPRIIPNLSGCFLLLRTSVLKEVGMFDERFFMYMEDVDLCRRFGRVSKTMFCPSATIYHSYDKGSYQQLRLLKYHLASAWRYYWKWGWFIDAERDLMNSNVLLSTQGRFSDRSLKTRALDVGCGTERSESDQDKANLGNRA